MTEPAKPPAEPEAPPPHPVIARLADIGARDESDRGQFVVRIDREHLLTAARVLRDEPNLKFDHLADVTAVDYLTYDPAGGPPGQGRAARFDVVYHLYSIPRNQRARLKVALDDGDARVDSVVGIWSSATWAERETFDMYGIEFAGHPDLTRILMPDDWQGHPLRKDYPLIEEEIEFTGTLERLNERRGATA